MLVPWEGVSNVLELLHDSPSAGLLGIEKTYQRACEKFYWPCVRRDARNWIESCYVCPKRKSSQQKHRHSLTKWKPSHPFWQVPLDIMGPPPGSQGNKYILLIGDQFSKWYEAIALTNQEAKTLSRALVEHWIVNLVLQSTYTVWTLCQNYFVVFAVNQEIRGHQQPPANHKGKRWLKKQIGQ